MEVLAKRLKWLREKQRYAQKDIAKKIGMTQSGYQKIEYGERDPKLDVLVSLCGIFGVTADFLLGISDVVEDLGELSNEISILSTKKHVLSRELEYTNYNLQDIKVALSEESNDNVNNLIAKSEMLNESKSNLEKQLYDIHDEFRKTIFNYLETLLNIPESDVLNNPIIKSLAPYTIELQLTIFDEFSLAIFCKEGFIGNYGAYKTEEEALELRKVLLTMLNSRN